MVYLGPINPRPERVKTLLRPPNVTAVRAYASEAQGASVDAAPNMGVAAPGGIERRKQDRRNKTDQTILETRAGRDRRKAPQPKIDITI